MRQRSEPSDLDAIAILDILSHRLWTTVRIYIFLVVFLSQIIYILNTQLSASLSYITIIERFLSLELTREEPQLSTNSQVRKKFICDIYLLIFWEQNVAKVT